MILKVILDENIYELNVPEAFLERAVDFFDKMDRDMDAGWQMSREWVDHPDRLQRCRIVTDKLVTALENENDDLGRLMAGYILSRAPEIETIEPDVSGETQNTVFILREGTPAPPAEAPTPDTSRDRTALEQAESQVSRVFKVGRQYRFSSYDPQKGAWEESPAIASEAQAEALRAQAVRQRYLALTGARAH